MSEEPGKELFEDSNITSNDSPYPIDWSMFSNDRIAYHNLLQLANPIDLWEDYAEFLSIEKRHLDYFKHVFLERESYLSFLDVLNEANSSKDFKMIRLGCEMIMLGTVYFCFNQNLDGIQVFVSMVGLGISVAMMKIIEMRIKSEKNKLKKREYLEYEKRNLRLRTPKLDDELDISTEGVLTQREIV
jgi:hypothetical protein